jgi:hypothetical protein
VAEFHDDTVPNDAIAGNEHICKQW